MQDDRSDKLVLTQTGSGGLDELRDVLADSKASFGYARVSYSNDKESLREKFVFVVWIGKSTKIVRKAKAGSLPWFDKLANRDPFARYPSTPRTSSPF